MPSPEVQELLDKITRIETDPASLNPAAGSLFKYKPEARKKLDALRREVAAQVRREKLARGETVNDAGYSGRQTNRR